MKIHALALLMAAVIFLVGCNLPRPTAVPSTTPSAANQGQPVGMTPSPTRKNGLLPANPPVFGSTNTPAQVPVTGSAAMVTPKTVAVNCRFGPGTGYLPTGGLKVGASVPIRGQTADGTWWQIQNPNNVFADCWVSAAVSNTTGNIASVPIVPAPVTTVTLVTVNTPSPISVPGCTGSIAPVMLTGSIDVNGPITVTYHFATQQGVTLPAHTLTITRYGPFNVTDSFTPSLVAGAYWVKLFVTAPNSLTAQANYTISCP